MKLRLITGLAALLSVPAIAHAGPHVGIGIRIGIPAPIIVREAPPPRVVERVITSPGPGYLWIPGHYTWAENRWLWIEGSWMLPPQSAAYWVDGRWNPQTREWIEAHWEAQPPPPAPTQPSPPPPPGTVSNVPVPSSPAPAVSSGFTEIIVEDAPPPPVHEVIVASPGHGYIWVDGYWGWVGGRREWVRGHWERPPHRHAVWVSPRWENRGHGYVYVRGFWR